MNRSTEKQTKLETVRLNIFRRLEQPDSASCISLVTNLFSSEVYCTVLKSFTTRVMVFLTPCSPSQNPVGELFSSWRWKVYDCSSYERTTLLQAICSYIAQCSSRCQPWKETLKLSWPVKYEQQAMMNDDRPHNIVCCDIIMDLKPDMKIFL